ncbi:unnamed protein product [Cunninghamella echinulata]
MNQKLVSILFMMMISIGLTFAATGDVTINGVKRDNPKGCYNVNLPLPLDAENNSDQTATFYVGSRCSGEIVGEVAPKSKNHFKYGASVKLD